jgi:hypothetical protein
LEFVSPNAYTFSEAVIAALNELDQGTILAKVPIVYAADGAHAVLQRSVHALGSTLGGVHLIEMDAMVTSQTCDIRGPGAVKKPFLTVAPVYEARYLSPREGATALRRRSYIIPLSGPHFANELYIADLRFEAAIEKSVVVGRQHYAPFSDRSESLELAKKLGESRRRAAFDPIIEQQILQPLENLLPPEYAAQIYEVRVDADPNISRASTVTLIVACYPDADVAALTDLLSAWYDDLRESLPEMTLEPLIVDRIDHMTLDSVRGSVPVYFSSLSDEATEL